MLVGTRMPGIRASEREIRAVEVRLSMDLLVSRDLFRLGFHIDSLSLTYPGNIEKTAEEAAREDNVPTETPTGIQRRLAAQGIPISKNEYTNLRAVDCRLCPNKGGAKRLKDWLSTLNSCPAVPDIKEFIKDHKLYCWLHRASAVKAWWRQPVTPKRTRSEHATEHVDVDHAVLRCIESKSWPGLVVAADLPGRGRGFIATKSFQKGDVVCHYNGEVIPPRNLTFGLKSLHDARTTLQKVKQVTNIK